VFSDGGGYELLFHAQKRNVTERRAHVDACFFLLLFSTPSSIPTICRPAYFFYPLLLLLLLLLPASTASACSFNAPSTV